ncbi:MAG: hypothetical protein M1536_09215 [Firmicutes bacterium]|nr:hypothetical protein [Bacillota bacterium]
MKTHEKFGTAIVILESGFKIDIASSRTEFYTRPAALPEVMESSIKQDLYRRDFTINAMAIKLSTKGFGQLLDFFGGQRDLKQGIVRVLHSLSFIEDPTRIFRAIRFEQRYNFKMDHHTESLIKDALSMRVFDRMTNERIRDEIILILSEAKPLPAVIRMDKLKILKLIHPEIHLNNKILEILQEITGELAQYGSLMQEEKLEKWIIYFLALVSQLKVEQIREIAEKYRVSSVQTKKLTFDREVLTGIIRKLSLKNIKQSDIYRELNPLSMEVLLYLIARTSLLPVKQRVALYLNKLRKIRPLVRGKDLEAWGYTQGPFYKEALEAVWDAQIDGIIKTKDEAKKYLVEKFSSS